MERTGADGAHDREAIIGTYDKAPSQGAFIGGLAIGLMAFLILGAIVGLIAPMMV